ncbi:MAG TPA: SDR family NAD(P)-dependent oxidoreductase, partial [Jatrophihabitantaceae bacterium]|nr:SDR family NAD(P)-dependent oxidoreductase [Jatrophihabitantaceae bacterium]
MDVGLAGAVALVTGGVRGVGRGIVDVLADAGATVITCARHEPERPREGVEYAVADVRDTEQMAALIDGIVARRGRLDVLVNNVGGAPHALLQDSSAT